MILDIKPSHGYGYDCFEDSIVSVVSWWGREHQMMFADSWNFCFDHADSQYSMKLGDRIDIKGGANLNYLKKYHGIKVNYCNDVTNEDAIEAIKKELSVNRPVILFIDPFYCAFDRNYQKYHGTHVIIINGFNENNNNFYFTDCTYMKENIEFPVNTFMECYPRYMTLELLDDYDKDINWYEYMKSLFFNLQNDSQNCNTFESIRKFADEIEKNLDFKVEMEGYYVNIFDAPLFTNVREIARSRKKFSNTLKYIGERYNVEELLLLSEKMSLLGSKWSVIESMIIKAYMTSDSTKTLSRIVNKIRAMADDEEDAANLLLVESEKYNSDINYLTTVNKTSDTQAYSFKKDIKLIDLTDYMNNNGFGSLSSKENSPDLTSTGYYFLRQGLPEEKIWSVGEMRFKFPDLYDGVNDNISCFNQKIKIPAGNYHSIMLLGCAEQGDFCDRMIVEYANGKHEEIFIKFTDWAGKPIFNETVAWQGEMVERNGENVKIFEVYITSIFANTYFLKCDGILKSIQLPDCPNIHIFAISLC